MSLGDEGPISTAVLGQHLAILTPPRYIRHVYHEIHPTTTCFVIHGVAVIHRVAADKPPPDRGVSTRMESLVVLLSLSLNVVVLVAVCAGLIGRARWTETAYGPASPARGILLAVYLAIGVSSVVLLVHPHPAMVAALLGVQVLYKVMSPVTVGTLRNPVVLSNLAIAAVHIGTLSTLSTFG